MPRLEFFGDAILDYAVMKSLFREHPYEDAGCIRRRKQELVCNLNLAVICAKTGFSLMLDDSLDDGCKTFVRKSERASYDHYLLKVKFPLNLPSNQNETLETDIT